MRFQIEKFGELLVKFGDVEVPFVIMFGWSLRQFGNVNTVLCISQFSPVCSAVPHPVMFNSNNIQQAGPGVTVHTVQSALSLLLMKYM